MDQPDTFSEETDLAQQLSEHLARQQDSEAIEEEGPGSLGQFIQRRLRRQTVFISDEQSGTHTEDGLDMSACFWQRHYDVHQQQKHTAGLRLNGVDTQMNAGIEQYLPTPIFRLRVIKERLARDLKSLQSDIRRHEQLSHSSPMKEAIQVSMVLDTLATLRERESQLLQHEATVDYQLQQLFHEQSWVFQWSIFWQQIKSTSRQWWGWLKQTLAVEALIRRLNPERAELNDLNYQLQAIVDTLASERQSERAADQELSEILNQYERLKHRLEVNLNQIQTPS